MEPATIQIKCHGALLVPMAELNDMQGNLKDLSEANYIKLRNSILTYGFSFPVFLWIDKEGTKWILDAHQRIRTLRKMQEEGYTVPDLPADIILAEDKKQAKEKLLLVSSRYGKITPEGLYEFSNEVGYELSDLIEDMLDLPEIGSYEMNQGPEDAPHVGKGEKKKVTCPACNHEFEV